MEIRFRATATRGLVLTGLAMAGLLAGCDGSPSGVDASGIHATASVKAALPPAQANASNWTAPIPLSLVPAAGAVLASGKVMLWAADSRTNFGGNGHTYSTLFDPSNNTMVDHDVTETHHDMFCPGTARLADGRLLVNGGLDAGSTSIYDPALNTWSSAAGMNIPRGYNSTTTLQDGSVMTLGGSWSGDSGGNRNAEVFTVAGGWRKLANISETPYRLNGDGVYNGWQTDAHMALIPTSNGRVLMAGPSPNMYWIDTTGNGTSTSAGVRGDDVPAFGGPMVMYDAGKILKEGGSAWNNGTPSSALAYIIDTTQGAATVTKLPSMAYPRLYSNSVVLPNGQVLIVGGQTFSQEFSDAYAVLAPELFDPATNTFTVLPAMSVARNYHSIAMLLPDARVISAGGGLCDCAGDHKDMQIMSPPYLYNADGSVATRPQIVSSPASVNYGSTATVSTNSAVTAFSLIRVSATTHTVNNAQRRVAVSFTAQGGNSYQLSIPSNPGILIPGQYMLFAMNAQGTPSVAAIVLVNNTGAATVTNPGTQTSTTGAAYYLALAASKTLTWSASNLPTGLTVDPAGAISGTPLAAGTWFVTITGTDGTQTISTDFLFTVTGSGGGTVYHTPSISPIANQSTAAGATVSLSPAASDPDGNAIAWSATGLPTGLTINASTGKITGTASTAGSFTVVVKVVNGGNLSATTSFTWTVVAGLPTVVSLPAPISATGTSVSYAPVITGGSAQASYSYDFGDGSGATAFAASPNAAHTFAAAGTYTVTLSIALTDGRNATQTFIQAIYPPGASALSRGSSNVMVEPRSGANARLWVVNQDNDTVSVFDSVTGTKAAEIAVGSSPRSVALGSDGNIWVSNKLSATLSKISPASLAVTATITLPRASQPFGIVVSPADGSLFVALEAIGQVAKLNVAGTSVGSVAVGPEPRHLAITSGGDQLLVSRFISRPMPGEGTATVSTTDSSGNKLGGEVVVVNPASLAIVRTLVLAHSTRTDTESQGRGLPNYLGAAAISPDGNSAWIPSKQDDILRGTIRDGLGLTFQNSVRSITSRIDLTSNTEDTANRVDHDNAGLASAAIYHPTGVYIFVALETNRQVAVIDAAGKRELFRYEVGFAPEGLALSADGLKLYVSNFMSRSVSVIDLLPLTGFGQTTGASVATWNSVGTEKLAAAVLKGKQLFYDARDTRLARDSYLSCAVCHNDGGHDGRTWDFTNLGEGLRNTIALKGRGGMGQGFLHWSANFNEVQDFEGQIRTFAGGTGLMSDAQFNTGTRSQPLGDNKAGVSTDLDALAAYLTSLNVFPSSPYRNADGTLTAAATAGKTVFAANNCASCHGGNGFTLSVDATTLKNIGTIKPTSGSRLGGTLPGIDIPTLRDVWSTAPYLHDGSAAAVADAIAAHNVFTLSATDLANVAEYVVEIGGEEAAPAGSLPGVLCATEYNNCYIPAGVTATVYFGANGSYVSKTGVTGTLRCGSENFGNQDPAFGLAKSCYYAATTGATPVPTVALAASPLTVAAGGTSTLTWSSTNATSCTASGGWTGAQAVSGTLATAALTATTTYTLTCTGLGGTSTPVNAVVTVTAATPAPTVTLNANPLTVATGGTSTLTWTSTNATACTASNGWTGAKAVNGTAATAALTATTTFTLTCTGTGGTSAPASAVVTVAGTTPAPVVTLTALPTSVATGGTSTLTWSSTNATACTASGGWTGAKAVNGTATTAALTAATTYTLTCTGLGGSAAASAVVTVTGAGALPGTKCATEYNPCNVPAGVTATVFFGANGSYVSKLNVTGTVRCSADNFGNQDPAFGVAKACYYLPNGSTTPAPTVALTANPTTVASGATSALTWTSTNATACTASNGWTGAQAVSGTATTGAITAATTYTLTCTGAGGTAAASAVVSLTAVTPAPIVTLTAAPNSVVSGATSTLTWTSTNATACTASNGWTGAQGVAGSFITPALTATTTFTLTCTGTGGTSTPANAVVTVTATPAPTVTLTAAPTAVASGGTTLLTWSSTNATGCTATNGWAGAQGVSGTFTTPALTATTTFTLTCTGTGGTSAPTNAVVTVTATPAPTLAFSATPASVVSGGTTTLTWSSTNATACTATNGWTGAKGTSGTLVTGALTATTTYTLTCSGTGGTTTPVNAVVTVSAATPAPTVTLNAAPSNVTSGNTTTLTWSSTNATACTASNGWTGAQAVSGTFTTGALTATTTYSLTCTGTGGTSAPANAVVTVAAATPAPTVTLTAAPPSVASGATTVLTWSSTNATACTATGGWTGAQATAGTFTTPALTANTTFTLTCSGVGGTSPASNAVVSVATSGTNLGTLCAQEYQTCNIPAGIIATVSFGSNGLYAQQTNITGSIRCSTDIFGDPAYGLIKACYYLQTGTTGTGIPAPTVALAANPATITAGATTTLTWSSTGATACTASGGWTGAQGVGGTITTAALGTTTTFTLTCSGAGGTSAPSSATVTVTAGTNNPGTQCATEYNYCNIPAGVVATVSFGANGSYVTKTGVTGGLRCGSENFGGADPAFGLAKACYYLQTGTTP